MLNIPPDRRGLIHENDVKALTGWKKILDDAFKQNLAFGKKAKADGVRGGHKKYGAENITDGDTETYWATDDGVTEASVTVDLHGKKEIKYIFVQEYIKLGQRVRTFDVEIEKDGGWEKVASSTTIGYKKILPLSPVLTSKVRIKITGARACPCISNVEVY